MCLAQMYISSSCNHTLKESLLQNVCKGVISVKKRSQEKVASTRDLTLGRSVQSPLCLSRPQSSGLNDCSVLKGDTGTVGSECRQETGCLSTGSRSLIRAVGVGDFFFL